ncbi:hypothetical protein ACFXQA_10385 [Microbacterium sp. P07]|uniref:hypothetical protein n=1 Tax=Microbacterium sp. P07 TaxID=3366952 RepID=UPI0037468C58
MTTAYDLLFATADENTASYRVGGPPSVDRPATAPSGWIGSQGPAIGEARWPRGPLTGLPMFHILTLRLPDEWHAHNLGFPAFALFQGEGQFAEEGDADPADPFVVQLAASAPHPTLTLHEDIIGGAFALVRLDEAEWAGGPTPPPVDVRREGEHAPDDEGPNAWDDLHPTVSVWLAERPDPNAGLAPVEAIGAAAEGPYRQPLGPDYVYADWALAIFDRAHLGGTAFPVQGVPAGLGPWYLEIPELPGMNIGGDGILQLDLAAPLLDWACG